MAITEFGGSGGGGSGTSLRMGPEQNTFQNTTEALTLTDRDNYFTANPSNLAIYNSNSSLLIRLIYNDGPDLITRYQSRLGGSWVDVTPVVTGPSGSVASLAAVQIGEIPFKQADGNFAGSNMRVLDDGRVLAPAGFGVESGSVSFGDVLTLSEASGFLAINNHLNNKQYTIVDYYTPRDAASAAASIFHLNGAEAVFIAQGTDTTTITTNPLITPNYQVQNTAKTNALTFRTGAAMTNVRIAITKVSNGVVAKYIPSKQAWLEGFGGIDWVLGDNTYDFNDTPLVFNAGDIVKFEVRADSVNLKGNVSNLPYFTATLQTGVFRDVIDDATYTASDIKSKLETLVSPNKLSKTAIQDVVNTVNGSTGDVVITGASLGSQPLDATLTGLAAVPITAGNMIFATGVDTFDTVASSPFGRSTLVDLSPAAGRATYGLGDVATRNVDVPNGIATLDGAGKLTQMPTKADVGLGNVDNTSDVNKPVSTAQSSAIAASIAAHNAAVDPHPQYTTTAEASAAAPVQSVAGKTGTVTLNTGDVAEATNLYYTDTRVDNRIIAAGYTVKSASSLGAGSPVYKANTAGDISFRSIIGTGIASVTTNTNDITINVPAAPVQSVNGQTGTVVLSTTNIAEGTNLYYTDARVGTYLTAQGYTVKSVNNIGAGSNVFAANTAGAVTLRSIIGSGGVTATQNANDITISTPAIAGGTYTPTLTNVSGVTSSSVASAQWFRVDGVVTVSGQITVDPTGAGGGASVSIGISLPVASDFANVNECAGTAVSPAIAGQCGAISADATNNRASFTFVSVSGTSQIWYYTYTYRVI